MNPLVVRFHRAATKKAAPVFSAYLVFKEGRKFVSAVTIDSSVRVIALPKEESRYFRPLELKGKPYPIDRAVRRFLRAGRSLGISKKAKAVLNSIKEAASAIASVSEAMSLSLANRLRATTASLGSTMYVLTWKARALPSGRSIPALRASVPRRSARDCTGWARPAARDWKDSPGMATIAKNPDGSKRVRLDQLPRQAQLTAGGRMPNGSTVETASGAALDPGHSRWLQGLPATWDACVPTETRSTRSRRPGSSAPVKRT